jgi:hypothetical protein
LQAQSRRSESNRRPADYKSAALPLSYAGAGKLSMNRQIVHLFKCFHILSLLASPSGCVKVVVMQVGGRELLAFETLETEIEEAHQSVQLAIEAQASLKKKSFLAVYSGIFLIIGFFLYLCGFHIHTDLGIWMLTISIILLSTGVFGSLDWIRHSMEAAKYRKALDIAERRLGRLVEQKRKEEERLAALARIKQEGFPDELLEEPLLAYRLYGNETLDIWFESIEHLYREDRSISIMGRAGYPKDWLWRKEWLKRKRKELCEWCKKRVDGSSRSLHVHHINTIAEGGTHDLWNLQLLCRECHEKAHGSKFDDMKRRERKRQYRS